MKLNYIEIPTSSVLLTKNFLEEHFSWSFTKWSEEYFSFSEGLDGAIYEEEGTVAAGALLVFKSDEDLEKVYRRLSASQARIERETFSFPGGRRFEFIAPGNVKMAVWSDEL